MEETISIQDIFNVVRQKISLIFTCMFVGIGIAALGTFFLITPKYSSVVQMIVQSPTNENTNAQLSDLNANILMINTYKDVIKSNTVLGMVREELGKENLSFTDEELKSMISIEQSQNSQMFEIKVVTTNPKVAKLIANTIAEVFKEQLINFIQVDKVTILSPAVQNDQAISPNKKLNILIGAVLGLMIGIGLAFISEFMNNTIKDSAFVTDVIDLPVLGTITQLTQKELDESKNIDFNKYRNGSETRQQEIPLQEISRAQRRRV